MEAIIYRGDAETLDGLIARTKLPLPYNDEDGVRIGNVIRIWRDGTNLKAEIECTPEECDRIARSAAAR